jgi:hypothetical protein
MEVRKMHTKRLVLALAIAAGVLAPVAAGADVNVNAFHCFATGGTATVAPGSTIVVRQGFAEQTRGVLTAFLGAQTSTVSVNGGPTVDVSGAYSAPTQAPDGSWSSFVNYPTGITLASGDSLSFTFTLSLSHVVPEVLIPPEGGEPGRPVFGSPATPHVWTCTVTAT